MRNLFDLDRGPLCVSWCPEFRLTEIIACVYLYNYTVERFNRILYSVPCIPITRKCFYFITVGYTYMYTVTYTFFFSLLALNSQRSSTRIYVVLILRDFPLKSRTILANITAQKNYISVKKKKISPHFFIYTSSR